MTNLYAQISATLHVMGVNYQKRINERGQTTAEYVGIVAFVALIVIALIGLVPGLAEKAKGIIETAFTKISEKLG